MDKEKTSPQMPDQKGKKQMTREHLYILLAILSAAIIGLCAYIVWDLNRTDETATQTTRPSSTSTTTEEEEEEIEEEETEDTTTESSKEAATPTGDFTVTFSYPSEGTPPAKLCFQNISDFSDEYCFFSLGLFSGGATADVSQYAGEVYPGNTMTASLPAGTYYGSLVTYGVSTELDTPNDIITLNDCTYPEMSSARTECSEWYAQQAERQASCGSCSTWGYMITRDRNVNYGGDPVTFTITEGQTLDMGTVSLWAQ